MKYIAEIDGNTYEIEITPEGDIFLDDNLVQANLTQVDPLGLYSLLLNHQSREVVASEQQHGYQVALEGQVFDVKIADERRLRMASSRADVSAGDGDLAINAPIPGLVVKVLVAEGDVVESGAPLVILEAMKMENEIRAPRAGVVQDIRIKMGESVEGNAPLLMLAALDESD